MQLKPNTIYSFNLPNALLNDFADALADNVALNKQLAKAIESSRRQNDKLFDLYRKLNLLAFEELTLADEPPKNLPDSSSEDTQP